MAISISRVQLGLLTFMLAFHFKDLDATNAVASKVGLAGAAIAGQIGVMVAASVSLICRVLKIPNSSSLGVFPSRIPQLRSITF